jgi:Mg/Co/Ni transporter MgtE
MRADRLLQTPCHGEHGQYMPTAATLFSISRYTHPARLCGNLTYADVYAEMLREKNTISWLKSSSSEQDECLSLFQFLTTRAAWTFCQMRHALLIQAVLTPCEATIRRDIDPL